jgi:hypothetical protein
MATINTAYTVFQLSEAEFITLSTTGTLTKDGVTYTYSPSDTIYVTPNTNIASASVSTIWTGTQAEYDAITTKDVNTLYFIVEAV